jgi:hypothetical protein
MMAAVWGAAVVLVAGWRLVVNCGIEERVRPGAAARETARAP